MIVNIIDRRKNKYKWKEITVIAEPTWHDNFCKNSDKLDKDDLWFGYDENEKCSLQEAIEWGNKFAGSNTLYVYDLGKGILTKENK